MRVMAFARAGGILGLGFAAAAQTVPPGLPERINGTVERFDGHTLTIYALDGRYLTIMMPDEVRIGSVADRRLTDIKPGDFVGSAAVNGRDGKLHAQEVHIFPEAMRGTGEGHRPMAGPEQTMTNAVVDRMAGTAKGDSHGGETLTLKYDGGEQVIEVAPDTRVVMLVPGDRTLLKPGAVVTVSALKAADGTLTARIVQAEKDGVKPLP